MTVKFFLDENIPNSSIKILEGLGYEVEHARTAGFKGSSDDEIARYAKEEKTVLVSRDLDLKLRYAESFDHLYISKSWSYLFTNSSASI